jgi:hypothetical protein
MPDHKPNGALDNGANSGANAELDALFWRDEILQVMYWMRGEGLSESVCAEDLLIFLDGDLPTIQHHLARAAAEGFLGTSPDGASVSTATHYTLTDLGRQEGGRRFRDEFAGMQKSGHGECNADCVCHTTGDHANCPSHGSH